MFEEGSCGNFQNRQFKDLVLVGFAQITPMVMGEEILSTGEDRE